MMKPVAVLIAACFCLSLFDGGQARADEPPAVAPWVFEFKGGIFSPDLDRYEEFYGSDTTSYFAGTVAYRPSDWYEIGGEIGYMRDSGVGFLAGNQVPGGRVKYELVPVHVYVSVFGRFSPGQWVVPYAGAGVTMAWYRQSIEAQPNRNGRTDAGYQVKAGLQLLLNGLDPGTARRAEKGGLKNTYLFLEAQHFSTEVKGIDLGGVTYLLGLRLEFDFGR